MKQLNARIIALGMLAAGLLLGMVALLSAYGESTRSAASCTAHYGEFEDGTVPRS